MPTIGPHPLKRTQFRTHVRHNESNLISREWENIFLPNTDINIHVWATFDTFRRLFLKNFRKKTKRKTAWYFDISGRLPPRRLRLWRWFWLLHGARLVCQPWQDLSRPTGGGVGAAAVLYRWLNFLAAFANIWRAFHTLSRCCAEQEAGLRILMGIFERWRHILFCRWFEIFSFENLCVLLLSKIYSSVQSFQRILEVERYVKF